MQHIRATEWAGNLDAAESIIRNLERVTLDDDGIKGEITTLNVTLEKTTKINITVYDLNGDPVKVLYNKSGNPGLNEIAWNGRNKRGKRVVQGVYFVVVTINKKRYVKKVLVVR